MRFINSLGNPPPKALYAAAEFVINAGLRRCFEEEVLNVELAQNLLTEAKMQGISLDAPSLEMALRKRIEMKAEALLANPREPGILEDLETTIEVLESLPFQVNLRKIQNICYHLLMTVAPEFQQNSDIGAECDRVWIEHFTSLCRRISIRVDA
jgi:hypothetical protein